AKLHLGSALQHHGRAVLGRVPLGQHRLQRARLVQQRQPARPVLLVIDGGRNAPRPPGPSPPPLAIRPASLAFWPSLSSRRQAGPGGSSGRSICINGGPVASPSMCHSSSHVGAIGCRPRSPCPCQGVLPSPRLHSGGSLPRLAMPSERRSASL